MSNTSHSHGHHHHHDHHDWNSAAYVSQWAAGQDQREIDRQGPFRLMAQAIPYGKELPIRMLDVGAGYGALTQFLLSEFPNATAVCQDGSEQMAQLGRERMGYLKGRFNYVLRDFSEPGWSGMLQGPFEAIVSSIAIHNVRSPDIIRSVYSEIFPLVKPGGCFLNFDRQHPPLEEQLRWLKEAGFKEVNCFWKDDRRALFGGVRK